MLTLLIIDSNIVPVFKLSSNRYIMPALLSVKSIRSKKHLPPDFYFKSSSSSCSIRPYYDLSFCYIYINIIGLDHWWSCPVPTPLSIIIISSNMSLIFVIYVLLSYSSRSVEIRRLLVWLRVPAAARSDVIMLITISSLRHINNRWGLLPNPLQFLGSCIGESNYCETSAF